MKDTYLAKCAQLDLLKELKHICEKNDIKYFLIGGTLIGAIRHGGFIPWDDDIDVGMLREDYEKFRKACESELNDAYMYHDSRLDSASPHLFAKLKIKGTEYVEELSKNTNMSNEIFIDVFPFDNAPGSKLKRIIHGKQIFLVRKILLLRCGFTIWEGGSVVKKILYSLLINVSKIKTIESWRKTGEKLLVKYNNKDSECVVSACGSYSYDTEMAQREYVKRTVKKNFEGISVDVPVKYHEYLTHVYGDYMQLPPEEKRVSCHGIQEISLGDYKIKSKLATSNME